MLYVLCGRSVGLEVEEGLELRDLQRMPVAVLAGSPRVG